MSIQVSDRFRQPLRSGMIAVGMVGFLMLTTYAQSPQRDGTGLPSESLLPDQVEDAADAPDESALPDEEVIDVGLPGEERMPGEAPPPGLPDAIRPWLRMDFEGHTGPIRSLSLGDDGKTLVSAGEDKDVHVWRRTEIGEKGWLHRRTIRWPIERGPRGRIYTSAIRGDLIAFAGHGAFGGLGEIRIVDAASGDLVTTLVDKHAQVVLDLEWAPGDVPKLASIDMEGQCTIWQESETSGFWEGKVVAKTDLLKYGEDAARMLRGHRIFVPMSFSGPDHLLLPNYPKNRPAEVSWNLRRVNLKGKPDKDLNDVELKALAVDCVSTPDGSVAASCDWPGNLFVSRLQDDGESTTQRIDLQGALPFSLDLDPSGETLLVGTRRFMRKEEGQEQAEVVSEIQLWDLSAQPPQLKGQRRVGTDVRDAVLDTKRREVLIAQESVIDSFRYDELMKFVVEPPVRLSAAGQPVRHVAFSKSGDGYKIAYATQFDSSNRPILEGVFDLSGSKLVGGKDTPVKADQFLPAQQTSTVWKFGAEVKTDKGPRAEILEGDQKRGLLPYQFELHGVPTSICTLPEEKSGAEEDGEKPNAGAVIIGTSGRNDIYAYTPDDEKDRKLLRHFRGHGGAVTSMSTSPDGKYLVSSSEDSTISIWNLQDMLSSGHSAINLWGVDFEIDGNQLIAAEVREDGPLYFRGVRSGDRLLSIFWADDLGNAQPAVADPEKMLDALLSVPFDRMIVFRFSRLGRPRLNFQSFAAWRPLATLFVDRSRDWAFWTPAGYYDASFNGHQLFGWQVDNGIDNESDFFRAAQFRKVLEAPAVMQRLLSIGNLPGAIRAAAGKAAVPEGQEPIVNQYWNKPKIEVTSTEVKPDAHGEMNRLTVTAAITIPMGASLVDPRAFVSGVPAVEIREIPAPPNAAGENDQGDKVQGDVVQGDVVQGDDANESETNRVKTHFQFDFRLPSDPDLQLEILAATEAEALDRVIIDLDLPPRKRQRARLHVLAIGASKYPDPQIPSLNFAADAAVDFTKLIQNKAASIYDVTADTLVNEDATRPMWRVFAQQSAEQLREVVSPDDLIIMYLCGHGIRDRRTNQWYFVTADTQYSDLMKDQYENCLSFSDLAMLSKIPCRKLAILDSCHSGAVQPEMRRDDLKSALRFLQDDVVLTITASEGDQEAAETEETRMGRFTTKLVEALSGAADRGGPDSDGVVTLNEVVDYVIATVTEESEKEGMPQHPTASPAYLLRTLSLPLTSVGN